MDTIETVQTVETDIARIPVSKLVISPLHARKKQRTGKYEAVAGGRRFAALKLLITDGRLPKDHEAECRVVG